MTTDQELIDLRAAALRVWAAAMDDQVLRARITHWEHEQTTTGGEGRVFATRVLGYLRREAKRRAGA